MSESSRTIDCAEYVLGTLPADERAAFERALSREPGLRDEVIRWEDWLVGLNEAIPEIEPGSGVWPQIQRRLRVARSQPETPPPANTTPPVDQLALLRRSRARWRTATLAFGAMAAGLLLFAVIERQQPTAASYLAVVNRGGDLPALVVHVDTGTDTVSVRTVAAETPAGRVLQLWYIAGGQTPRSLGLLDRPDTRAALPAITRSSDLAGATLAVSVEPTGGSPTGAPTGQVIYSGKLFRDR